MSAIAEAVADVKLPGMAKNKPKDKSSKKPNRKPAYTLYARINLALGEALERFIRESRPKPTTTTTTEAALEAFLQERGYWPPRDAVEGN